MKKTKEEALETRTKILKAAIQVFSKKGYDSTTIVDIANEAGLTRGAVYWHFKDKTELFIKLNEEYGHGFIFEMVAQLANNENLSSQYKISFGLLKYFEMLETNEDFRCIEEISSKMFTSSDEKVKEYFAAEIDNLISCRGREIIGKIINEGKAKGEIIEEVNIIDLENAMVAMVIGTQILWLMSGKKYSVLERGKILVNGIIKSIIKQK